MSRAAEGRPAPRRPIVVAIAGRPNAGKSTLFNRLLRRRQAIVERTPGVTRDENRAALERSGRRYELIDTGGIEERALGPGLAERVQRRSLVALRSADVIVHVVDGQAGLSPHDRAVAAKIRALGVPTVMVVNKIDRPEHVDRAIEFLALGDGEPIAVSAAHGRGVDELWECIDEAAAAAAATRPESAGPPAPPPEAAPPAGKEAGVARAASAPAGPPSIALIGRPNVGKSSLLNRIVGYERALVDPGPGTTRDALDVMVERVDRRYLLVDTAGLRRPSRVVETIESHAAAASIRALARAEVAVLVVDAAVGLADQDLRLADLVWRRGRGLVVAVNKSDLVSAVSTDRLQATIARRLPQWPPLAVARVSALDGTGLGRLFLAIDAVVDGYRRRLPTPRLNAVLRQAVERHPPPLLDGRRVKMLYATQVRAAPQEVALFLNRRGELPPDYVRYLTRHLREAFALAGVPVKLLIRLRHRTSRSAGERQLARPRARR